MSYIALMPKIIGSDFPWLFLCILTFILPETFEEPSSSVVVIILCLLMNRMEHKSSVMWVATYQFFSPADDVCARASAPQFVTKFCSFFNCTNPSYTYQTVYLSTVASHYTLGKNSSHTLPFLESNVVLLRFEWNSSSYKQWHRMFMDFTDIVIISINQEECNNIQNRQIFLIAPNVMQCWMSSCVVAYCNIMSNLIVQLVTEVCY